MNHIVSSVEFSSPMLVMSFCSSYFTSYEAKHCYELSNPINCQFWHHSCIWFKELPPKMVSHPYLILRNKWDIKHFLFLLTFSYHWEILYEPHCQQCWVKFTHAGHVILQLILYKLWSKTLLMAHLIFDSRNVKLPFRCTGRSASWSAHTSSNSKNLKLPFWTTRCQYWGR